MPHPPAAATALLITSGVTRPGAPLCGMMIGLTLVLAVAPVLARIVRGPSKMQNEDG